jgi:hypothetical protein
MRRWWHGRSTATSPSRSMVARIFVTRLRARERRSHEARRPRRHWQQVPAARGGVPSPSPSRLAPAAMTRTLRPLRNRECSRPVHEEIKCTHGSPGTPSGWISPVCVTGIFVTCLRARERRSHGIATITTRPFVTDPPWSRPVLHEIIVNLSNQAPAWLLLDGDWGHTQLFQKSGPP